MGYLDNAGLAHLWGKLKEKFIRSVNGNTPDTLGNVEIKQVDLAENLVSPDSIANFDSFVWRTSGGDADISNGDSFLSYIRGYAENIGYEEESIEVGNFTGGITATLSDADAWKTAVPSSGTYIFQYNGTNWSCASETVTLSTYGLTVSGIIAESVTISAAEGEEVPQINKATFKSFAGTPGTYVFTNTESKWYVNGGDTEIQLGNYGITYTGTATLTVVWIPATSSASFQVAYTKKNQGEIKVALKGQAPTKKFYATGFNQYNPTTGYAHLINYNNTRDPNGYQYRVYPTDTVLTFSELPAGETTSITTDAEGNFKIEQDGYVHASGENILIALTWSGSRASDEWEAYQVSEILIPETDADGETLPWVSHGMPSIGNTADELSFDYAAYTQRIGYQEYSDEALEELLEAHPTWVERIDYIYDADDIYFVLEQPTVYNLDIDIDGTYTVNDYGIEGFEGTEIGVPTMVIYGQNLRDKLRSLNIISRSNISVGTGVWDEDTSGTEGAPRYEDYPYVAEVPVSGIANNMFVEVVFDVADATSGLYAPVCESTNNAVKIWSSEIPDSTLIIKSLCAFRGNA